ncbi:MAG: NUDIX domain-containing protein [Phycisphaerales bacterium]|nr:NUDIX domain-containing protein [Phycisphaerales bacterium]
MSERQIELIARAAIFRDGRVLLCRNVESGYLFLPGGHVEFGESALAAVARELQEEAGIAVVVGGCAMVDENAFQAANGRRHHEVNVVFHVELVDPAAEIRSRESHIEFLWADLAAVVDLDLRPDAHRAWLASGAAAEGGTEWVSAVHS